MNNDVELTLLSEEDIWGENSLEVLKKYGVGASITDLCILTGGYFYRKDFWFWTSSNVSDNDVCTVGGDGTESTEWGFERDAIIRPILQSSVIFSKISSNRMRGYNGTEEVEYGEYPQNAVDSKMQNILELEYNRGIDMTGRSYTFDSVNSKACKTKFKPVTYREYKYQEKKYICIKANFAIDNVIFKLSNGVEYRNGDYVWVEVSPVKWLIDDKTKTLISKSGLVSGIRFLYNDNTYYNGDFSKTEIKEYLDKYMVKDLFQNAPLMQIQDITKEQKQVKKKINPYGLKFGQISEENIIKGAIESGVAVFLHGPSSEGKSARVKQIDPNCEIIYLRNATPESLNGKSVYNQSTGEMIDIKPSWLKKIEEKCKIEPDRLHIVFFDEITNALPSIQGIAFNIVLDREVNGIWKLPDNARIVAAGNDMKDSLAANQLAEPLFNRFAHVYIKTTTESWLKWASKNNIHPAIYAYIAYKKGKTLRSEYNGEKPNADPRKWEMASKMLYKAGNPEMLRSLVGEDITREFVAFCNQEVITLEDVLNDNYTDNDIYVPNIAKKYATVMGLTQVDEDNLVKVRDFIMSVYGEELCSLFDLQWCHGDERRLELIAEAKLTRGKGKVKK